MSPCWYCNDDPAEAPYCEACKERESWARDLIDAQDEIERLRRQVEEWRADRAAAVIEVDRLQALIDAWAEALSALTRGPVGDRLDALCMALNAAEEALLAAATPKEDES